MEIDKKADVHTPEIADLLDIHTTILVPTEQAAADNLVADSIDMQITDSLAMYTAASVPSNNTAVTDMQISDEHKPLTNILHGNTSAINHIYNSTPISMNVSANAQPDEDDLNAHANSPYLSHNSRTNLDGLLDAALPNIDTPVTYEFTFELRIPPGLPADGFDRYS